MKKLTLAEAKADAERQALWVWRQENWGSTNYHWGANDVSDDDEDYVLDALFEIPNR